MKSTRLRSSSNCRQNYILIIYYLNVWYHILDNKHNHQLFCKPSLMSMKLKSNKWNCADKIQTPSHTNLKYLKLNRDRQNKFFADLVSEYFWSLCNILQFVYPIHHLNHTPGLRNSLFLWPDPDNPE